jgi:uridine phosphorylase
MSARQRKRVRRFSDLEGTTMFKRRRLGHDDDADAREAGFGHMPSEPQAPFPVREDGTTLHLNVKRGDVANRILSVGDTTRAIKLSKFFDKPAHTVVIHSEKTFKVFTGTFKGVPLSIVATGMGYAMIDFVVREIRHVVEGPLAMIRLGTCGVIHPDYDAGQILVATKGSTFIQTNHDQIIKGNMDKAYTITKPVKSDIPLSSQLVCNLRDTVGKDKVKQVMNCSADSFYCSEGRIDPNFIDLNDNLIKDLRDKYPEVVSLEMESFGLLSLATKDMHCTACAIGLIHQRVSQILHLFNFGFAYLTTKVGYGLTQTELVLMSHLISDMNYILKIRDFMCLKVSFGSGCHSLLDFATNIHRCFPGKQRRIQIHPPYQLCLIKILFLRKGFRRPSAL